MSNVVSIEEKIGVSGEVTTSSAQFVREFIVKLDAPSNVGQDIAINASAPFGVIVPEINSLWPNNISGRATPTLRKKSAQLLDRSSRLLWLVTCDYSNERRTEKEDSDPNTPPWNLPVVYGMDGIEYQRSMEQDFTTPTAQAVVNVVGDPFDPVPHVIVGNGKITAQRNTRNFSETTAAGLRGKINSEAFSVRGMSYAAKKLRLLRWVAQDAYWTDDGGLSQKYQEETIELEVAYLAEGFTMKILNQGYRARPTAGADPARVTGAVEPVLLAADGTQLAIGGTPVFLDFEPYEQASFTGLGSL